jgi:hypothetical protein
MMRGALNNRYAVWPVRIFSPCILACYGFLAHAAQPPQSLDEVKTVVVDSLGQGEWPTIIRDKIINRLVASGRFQVVFDPDKADAILTGSVIESQVDRGFDVTAVVRLMTKDQRILWVSEAKNNKNPFARSASSSVADRIVKDLLKAVSPPKKRK